MTPAAKIRIKRPPKIMAVVGEAGLARGRCHEAFGAGARAFAAICAGVMSRGDTRAANENSQAVVWIRPARARCQLNPQGLAHFIDPAEILLAECARPLDILWTMEEALRLGPAGLVIAELPKPPDLTVSRRLQLAAEAGGATGLCLVDDTPITNASETRWFCAPVPSEGGEETTDSTSWRLSLIKNKRGTLGAWEIEWNATARAVTVVSGAAGGPDGTP